MCGTERIDQRTVYKKKQKSVFIFGCRTSLKIKETKEEKSSVGAVHWSMSRQSPHSRLGEDLHVGEQQLNILLKPLSNYYAMVKVIIV